MLIKGAQLGKHRHLRILYTNLQLTTGDFTIFMCYSELYPELQIYFLELKSLYFDYKIAGWDIS